MKKYSRSEIETFIKIKVAEMVGTKYEFIQESSMLGHIGLDSLDCIDLIMKLESEYSIDLSMEFDQDVQYSTLGDFIDAVHKVLINK